jgi:hypothetical protein
MTYNEAMEGHSVTRRQAFAEIEDHGLDVAEFIEDCGDSAHYNSREVLEWLGY